MATHFRLIHVAAGFGITYYVVAGWFNRTQILVGSEQRVERRHGITDIAVAGQMRDYW